MRLVVDWKLWQLRKDGIAGVKLRAFRDAMLKTSSGSVREIWKSIPPAAIVEVSPMNDPS